MHILIAGHSGLANRGCEALLRSTVALVRQRQPDATFAVPSVRPHADQAQWPEAAAHGVQWVSAPQETGWMQWWSRVGRRLPAVAAGPWPLPRIDHSLQRELERSDLLLSIGGDNYTLDYDLASLALHTGLAQRAQQMGIPTVLWGASIGPFDRQAAVQAHLKSHLRGFSGITVRESLSAAVLMPLLERPAADSGAPLVQAVADPAFTLQPEPLDLQRWWPRGPGPVLGLNISPLALPEGRRVDGRGTAAPQRTRAAPARARQLLIEEVASFITELTRQGRARVLLVAHVTARDAQGRSPHALHPNGDDALLLDELQHRMQPHEPAVSRLPAWNAAQLKYALAHCDVFIGARTHSVIAALSSGVPAVALSYSQKARGIHRDLFGHEQGVMPARLISTGALHGAFDGLLRRQQAEAEVLRTRLPRWKARAAAGTELLQSVMDRRAQP